MIAEAVRWSPLADYAVRFTALFERSNGAISIRELPFVTQFNLRADPSNSAIMDELGRCLGASLPRLPNTVTSVADRRILWLGPDEWLVVAGEGQDETIRQALQAGLNGSFGSIVDVSALRCVVHIGGARAGELLAHGMSIDLDPRVFGPGQCAQTLLAKAQVIIEHPAADEGFHLYLRSSFASHVAEWLLDAALD